MTKLIDSDALGLLDKALGLAGSGSRVTELTDGVVDQVLDVAPIVRRSRTQAGTQGLYTAILQNVHVAASERLSNVLPYQPGEAISRAPYPDPMPAQFDIWILNATLRRISGTGTITATLIVQYPATQQAWGVDNLGAAVVGAGLQPIAFWDSLRSPGSARIFVNAATGHSNRRIGLRLPRSQGTQVNLRSTSSDVITVRCDLLLGVFPISLGQDGIL